MTSSSEVSLVGAIVNCLRDNGSWTGETHIQKTSYILKAVDQVPLDSDFILYKHGPFSFDLNSVIYQMRAQNILRMAPQGNYGSTFETIEPLWAAVDRASGFISRRYIERIQFVCERLARKKVTELEKIATAIYVFINFDLDSELDRAKKLVELKPHIQLGEAVVAVEQSKVFTDRIRPSVAEGVPA